MNGVEILELLDIESLLHSIKIYIDKELQNIEELLLTKKDIYIYIIESSEIFENNKLEILKTIISKATGDYKIISLFNNNLIKVQYELDKKLEKYFEECKKLYRDKKITPNIPESFTISAKKSSIFFCNCDYSEDINYLKFSVNVSNIEYNKLSISKRNNK